MKKLLILGGSRYILPVIKIAKRLGYYVITCDYLPDNIAHKFSDEYHNVSIVDKEAVLQLAKELNIDGIMSFACDPGVVTAAYVADRLGLLSNPYESVCILQNKALFRKFLTDNGFNVPKSKGYKDIAEALKDAGKFDYPVIVKPTDSAGSKGVSRVDCKDDLEKSISYALSFSKSKEFIIEDFIEKNGDSSDSDCFSINEELVFASFDNQKFDIKAENPYTPAAYTWPSNMKIESQKYLITELQRLFHLLKLKTSIYNVETREGINGKPYIMEVSPRGGGNRLSEVLQLATNEPIIENAIRSSVGEELLPIKMPRYNGLWAEIILHSEKAGVFDKLVIDDSIKENIVEVDLWVNNGDEVHDFSSANFAIGTLVLKFDTSKQLETTLENIRSLVKVSLK